MSYREMEKRNEQNYFATGNAGKMKEIREILGDMDAEILSMKEAGSRRISWKTGRHLRKMPE